jgi:hypothetical protein
LLIELKNYIYRGSLSGDELIKNVYISWN